MVFVTLPNIVVSTETFVVRIVIVVRRSAYPAMAFYAEVVVAFACELAPPGSTLEQTLCQCDACRYLVAFHLLYGEVSVLVDVRLVCRVPTRLGGTFRDAGKYYRKNKLYLSHIQILRPYYI